MWIELAPDQTHCKIKFADQILSLLSLNALYWPATEMLILADLHLEKGSHYATKGNLIPIYDTADTLQKIDLLIEQLSPKEVLCLGDNVHDNQAFNRMRLIDSEYLTELCQKVKKWHWIIGNHDHGSEKLLLSKKSYVHQKFQVNGITFTHEWLPLTTPQIIGHFHPKKTVSYLGQKIQGKCFVVTPTLMIMPSFGSFTGGLDVKSSPFDNLIQQETAHYFLIKNKKIWVF